MGLTEQIFGNGSEKFTDCVSSKIADLNEKYKNYLSEQNIDLNTDSYIITYGQSGTGRVGFSRSADISNEINSEIDKVLRDCAEEHLQKL
ncbi:hypothetical protein [Chryseobacterium sp. 5_R23647]|uniref:hypothetical protein n=1 Tax=Chryseobacterium sp. 5_R23647 TaxID=2258964 RepID=UPI000E24D591|nr:hypothetical protein [Chryseobacterium sp. 5_R23647]REC42018.1 hypothetical protein DRF69_12710 [Chryseobacterium sp. 5_R23647]